jgi:hypothetical protein
MKKILFSLVCLLTAGILHAQSNAIGDFENRYHSSGKYFSIRIEGGILKLLADLETDDQDTKDFIHLINGINSIDIHSICKSETHFDDSEFRELLGRVKSEKYEDLMVVKDHDSNINFLIKENKGRVSDLVMLVNNLDEFLVMNITGDIDMHSIAKLSEKVNCRGCENLEKLKDE